MKKVLILAVFTLINLLVYSQETGIQFDKNSKLSDLLIKSGQEGKLVFIDCYTSWCGPCKYLANKVFTQNEVGDYFNEHFINAAFDMEKVEGIEIAQKYRIQAYPTLLFLNSKGEVVYKHLGACEADCILTLGKNATDTGSDAQHIEQRIINGDRSTKTIMLYLDANLFADNKSSILEDYFNYCSFEEKFSETSWKIINNYLDNIDHPFFRFFIDNRTIYENRYGKDAVKEKIKTTFDWMFSTNAVMNEATLIKLQTIDPVLYTENSVIYEYYTARTMLKFDFENKDKWDYYLLKAKAYCSLQTIDNMELNNIAWNIYENYKTFNDTTALRIAFDWSYKAYLAMPESHYINDTYAHFLYAYGNKKEAIKIEQIAYQKAKAEGFKDAETYAAEIKKFKTNK